jgi:hypothetical protein
MLDLDLANRALWDSSILLRFLVLCLLLFRNNARSFPFFSVYLSMNFLQSLLLVFTYKFLGETSPVTFAIAWGSQAVVTFSRGLAVAELCRLLLAGYRGVWSLAKRVLLSSAVLVLLYAAVVSRHDWSYAIFSLNRALELAVVAVIVVLFVFLRHYQVVAEPTSRALVLGFCLYSSVAVVNSSIFEQLLARYYPVWNLLTIVAFMACLLVWAWALRKAIPRRVIDLVLLPGSIYGELSPAINMRLYMLNERLAAFWKVERPRP